MWRPDRHKRLKIQSVLIECSYERIKMEITKIQKLLVYGMSQFNMDIDNERAIFSVLKEEDDQLAMIKFLMMHPEATEQEILNESGRILKQRKKLTEAKESE